MIKRLDPLKTQLRYSPRLLNLFGCKPFKGDDEFFTIRELIEAGASDELVLGVIFYGVMRGSECIEVDYIPRNLNTLLFDTPRLCRRLMNTKGLPPLPGVGGIHAVADECKLFETNLQELLNHLHSALELYDFRNQPEHNEHRQRLHVETTEHIS